VAQRPNLNRARIIDAAARVADRGGLAGVSMRSVGTELGVEAMSLYHHIDGKDALLDDLADWVFLAIPVPGLDAPWRAAMTARAAGARLALSEHPWALGLIESRRAAGPALLRHHDGVLGCLRRNGFSVALAAHAISVLDAYVYGFVLTEVNLPMAADESAEDFVAEIGVPLEEYPYLAEMVREQVVGREYAYADEFDYGLGLILDGLEARLAAAGAQAGG
jgi:AcrR family transcriptional regulator